MVRKFWLVNPTNGERWDLTPENKYATTGGCPIVNVKGLGYASEVEKNKTGIDYVVTNITSKNVEITGKMYFYNDKHKERFMAFIGSLDTQLEFHYSPDGKIKASDLISPSWYKMVILNITIGEKNNLGIYEADVTMKTLSDVWKKDISVKTNDPKYIGEAHVYDYFYNYTYSGKDAIACNITNFGREIGCLIKVRNNGTKALNNVEWYKEHIYIDNYGQRQSIYQRARFLVTLDNNYELQVDSNNLTQRAEVKNYNNDSLINVINNQELDWDYINFIRLEHGNNRIIFFTDNRDDIVISVTYTLQSEIPY